MSESEDYLPDQIPNNIYVYKGIENKAGIIVNIERIDKGVDEPAPLGNGPILPIIKLIAILTGALLGWYIATFITHTMPIKLPACMFINLCCSPYSS